LKDIVGGWAGELPTVEDMEKVAELLNGYKNQSIMNNGKTGILNKVSEIRNDAEKPVESESDKMNRELAGGLRELFHGNKTKKLVK
jgi:hypothetical protein